MAKYIDRDMAEQALIKEAALILRKMPYITIADSADRMIKIVQEVPAADVEPVRHGKWEAWMPDKNGETREFICTGCRFMVEMSWKQKECDYEWCPYCGCKMDKEEK